MPYLLPAALLVASYLIGSIPFSFLIVHMIARADIRLHGSGNVGATNVLRNFGKLPGFIALLLDLAKGWTVVTIASIVISIRQWPFDLQASGGPLRSAAFWIGLSGLCAVVGHMFPVWLGFHGGKGVATGTGVYLAIDPVAIGIAAVLFLIVVVATRHVSLASIAGAAAVPLLMRFLTNQPFWTLIFSIIIALAVIVRHRRNIERLAAGTEQRIDSGRDGR
jgi:glycerol-3-phosphate acyltransferase PlsY